MKEDDYSDYDIVKATQYGILERCKHHVTVEGFDVRTPDDENITVLHWAAINNRLEIAKFYISNGAVVDVLGGDLMATPLHWAVRHGHLEMVVLLIKYGADPGVRDSDGCAALHAAAQCGQTHICMYLISKGVDVDVYDSNGKTALMWSAQRVYSVDPTRSLLAMNADVNKLDIQYRNTPLHWACIQQNSNVIMLLLKHGADTNSINAMKETAMDISKQKENKWILGRLQQWRREHGFNVSDNIIQQYTNNKKVRERVTFSLSFLIIFFIGFIFELQLESWLLKIAIICVFYAFVHVTSKLFITTQETQSVLSISISFATKFWTYVTSLVYYLPQTYSVTSYLVYVISSVTMWRMFYRVVTSDPGVVRRTEGEKKQKIVEFAEANKFRMLDTICNTCLIVKPLRSKHCAVKDVCIGRYDHYCPWVLNTIGSGNHHLFISYLMSLFVVLCWHFNAALTFWMSVPLHHSTRTFFEQAFYHMRNSPWILWIFINTCFHLMWVSALLISQLYQMVYLGITTNERINAHRYDHFKSVKHKNHFHYENPFNRDVINNASDLFRMNCFGRARMPLVDWTTKTEFHPEFKSPDRRNHETV